MEKKIYIVGIGPGAFDGMTLEARRALQESRVIAGYTVYVELVREHFPDKEFLVTPMKQEVKRCRMALEAASEGKTTAMVCSGDAGVYGMAGLILELLPEFPGVTAQVVPGVTAALSGGALLGAPLTHDFAVISLSDLLTPMEVIEKRLRCAAAGDFSICIYNPSSRKRAGYLRWACGIILEYQKPETVCGLVKNIGREGETAKLMTLKELLQEQTDMFTTVFIGNSGTKEVLGRMVTPRGYRDV